MFKQTPRDVIFLFNVVAGLDVILQEWREFCRKAWENDYEYLRIDRVAKIRDGRYAIRNWNESIYVECTPGTSTFY